MRLRPSVIDALDRGRALFNQGRYWDAHEAWEEAWLVEDGDVRRLLQGLIQIAAGCHHAFVTRRPHGAVKLLSSGLEKLHTIPDGLGGLALEPFRTGVARAVEAVRSWQRGECPGVDPAIVPLLALDGWRGAAP
jgi:predicted metal-dependent hydrolase